MKVVGHPLFLLCTIAVLVLAVKHEEHAHTPHHHAKPPHSSIKLFKFLHRVGTGGHTNTQTDAQAKMPHRNKDPQKRWSSELTDEYIARFETVRDIAREIKSIMEEKSEEVVNVIDIAAREAHYKRLRDEESAHGESYLEALRAESTTQFKCRSFRDLAEYYLQQIDKHIILWKLMNAKHQINKILRRFSGLNARMTKVSLNLALSALDRYINLFVIMREFSDVQHRGRLRYDFACSKIKLPLVEPELYKKLTLPPFIHTSMTGYSEYAFSLVTKLRKLELSQNGKQRAKEYGRIYKELKTEDATVKELPALRVMILFLLYDELLNGSNSALYCSIYERIYLKQADSPLFDDQDARTKVAELVKVSKDAAQLVLGQYQDILVCIKHGADQSKNQVLEEAANRLPHQPGEELLLKDNDLDEWLQKLYHEPK